jgi:hypothetical protein
MKSFISAEFGGGEVSPPRSGGTLGRQSEGRTQTAEYRPTQSQRNPCPRRTWVHLLSGGLGT